MPATVSRALHPDAESLATLIAAWDANAPRNRTMDDYVPLADLILKTFGQDTAEDVRGR
ncbi:hypothetical protein ACH4GK_37390 [Streptomyces rimosus]|uniref:hypothetical protein n=1 Tax=Streptomyces rimosus TaxID=1927 RepID=UPI000A7BBE46|nr:hypothetical protein [Streptomyces rimosus]